MKTRAHRLLKSFVFCMPYLAASLGGCGLSSTDSPTAVSSTVLALPLSNGELRARIKSLQERAGITEHEVARLSQISALLDDQSLPPGVRRLPDGNLMVELAYDGAPSHEVMTMGPRWLLGVLAQSSELGESHEHQIENYRFIAERVAPEILPDAHLPMVEEIAQLPTTSIRALIEKTVTSPDWQAALARRTEVAATIAMAGSDLLPPPSYLIGHGCSTEEGGSAPGDGSSACLRLTNGMYERSSFPLKDRETCVKNQGRRGTCASFAVTAAMETAVALRYRRFVNFSEQHLYASAKAYWFPADYGDGLWPYNTIDMMRLSGWSFPREDSWIYNPSYSRIDLGVAYANSCSGYAGPMCGETTHQAQRTCASGGSPCWYQVPTSASTGFVVSSDYRFNPDSVGINLAITMLTGSTPVVLSIDTNALFNRPLSNGAVVYVPPGMPSTGGHAILAVGYVSNGALPAGYGPDPGGGYFIVKNSWGCGWGDGGYVYLPVSYFQYYGQEVAILFVS